MPSLSIRQKIFSILICYVIGILGMSVVSQNDIFTAKEKMEVVELAYSLNAVILEARRYEKNFLLYGTREALTENQRLLGESLATLERIDDRGPSLKIHPMLDTLKMTLAAYQQSLKSLAAEFLASGEVTSGSLETKLREQGQKMTELSKELVRFEHLQILSILNALLEQMVLWTLVAITVGIFIPILMSLTIFKPLAIIKQATEDIAQGRFRRTTVVNTRDEMQQVMEALNTMVGELERRQAQLVESQKLSSLGTLTAGIAHQLNNPLNNISTSCQIATLEFAEGGDTRVVGQMLDNIDQETSRARDVVQGLLEFSRTKEFTLRPASVLATVERTVKLVRSQVPASVRLVVEVPDDLVVPMDAQRMQEVLINMLINAAQAIEGEGRITLAAVVDSAGNEAIITVRDTGAGIPDEIKNQLFDPFYTTKEEGHGTGLGLSIAYGIVQQHHGNIEVESTPGQGAAFHIHLPLVATAGEA